MTYSLLNQHSENSNTYLPALLTELSTPSNVTFFSQYVLRRQLDPI